jgi:hypothetical protein
MNASRVGTSNSQYTLGSRQMDNIVKWFFTARSDYPDTSFNFMPWLIVIGGSLALWVYYWVEGRKKIPWIKNNIIWKQMILDRLFTTPQVPIWAFVGLIILGAQSLDTSFFSWRIWLDIWILWGALIVAYWIRYFIRDYPRDVVAYQKFQERAKYLPGMGRGRRAAARR